jgi:hypothetical protein
VSDRDQFVRALQQACVEATQGLDEQEIGEIFLLFWVDGHLQNGFSLRDVEKIAVDVIRRRGPLAAARGLAVDPTGGAPS